MNSSRIDRPRPHQLIVLHAHFRKVVVAVQTAYERLDRLLHRLRKTSAYNNNEVSLQLLSPTRILSHLIIKFDLFQFYVVSC